ncbi:hypothetical protein CEXT_300511 [Caerostris extrusa]|uniref:Uncharacterized protein n=1 Tax=Caerostris extrusa TaxID=172846 RepID=A0AAV4PD96_CAEEX|nr:hypothetical protein CEXT_300511 [Caerostris extrusa]
MSSPSSSTIQTVMSSPFIYIMQTVMSSPYILIILAVMSSPSVSIIRTVSNSPSVSLSWTVLSNPPYCEPSTTTLDELWSACVQQAVQQVPTVHLWCVCVCVDGDGNVLPSVNSFRDRCVAMTG